MRPRWRPMRSPRRQGSIRTHRPSPFSPPARPVDRKRLFSPTRRRSPPSTHGAGLGVVWRAIGAGVPLRVVPAFDAEAVLDALRRGPASHVSLVPTQLVRLLDASAASGGVRPAAGGVHAAGRDTGHPAHPAPAQPGLRAVLLGGAPIPQGLVTRALAAG